MSHVQVCSLTKRFGDRVVLNDVDLEVPEGQILAILGPSGEGKTTLLRIIAGFLDADEGSVRIADRDVTRVPPQRRSVGYVPQEGALFPHLNVRDNILFGLPRRERTDERLAEMLALAELPAHVARQFPHQLSGGQQQRVALARALATRPQVVLLDEPFSSLDAGLRENAGREVAALLHNAGATAILVTHDQAEALSLADQVAVMQGGSIAQLADPVALYRDPVSLSVGTFVGGALILPAIFSGDRASCVLGDVHVVAGPETDRRQVLIRHEQVELTPVTDGSGAGVVGSVVQVRFYGHDASIRITLDDGTPITARVPAHEVPEVGDRVGLRVRGEVRAFS